MITNNEVVHRILHLMKDSDLSDDNDISKQLVLDSALESRALVIKQSMKTGENIPDSMQQYLNCIELEEVDMSDHKNIQESGIRISKSVKPIPTILHTITVATPSGNRQADYIRWENISELCNSRIPSDKTRLYYTYKHVNGEFNLYMVNAELLRAATIRGVFQKPYEAESYCGDLTAICDPMSAKFYSDALYTDMTIKQSVDFLAKSLQLRRPDIMNDDTNIK